MTNAIKQLLYKISRRKLIKVQQTIKKDFTANLENNYSYGGPLVKKYNKRKENRNTFAFIHLLYWIYFITSF